jgi:hypothetical protein
MNPSLPGKVIWSPHNTPWGDKVFYVYQGKRHWMPNVHYLHSYGVSLNDVVLVTPEERRQYHLARPVPLIWPGGAWESPPRTSPTLSRRSLQSSARSPPQS